MDALISFDGFADVANNLINKVSDVVGWTVNHSTPKREALSTYIESVKAMDIGPLEKAAYISEAKKVIKAYQNQNKIIEQAVQYLKPSAQAEKMSDDWIAQFMNKAGCVYDKDFQVIWGKILAEECNEPGSIPKALLHVLEQMDNQHAKTFSLICSLSVCVDTIKGREYHPVIPFYKYKDFFTDMGLAYDDLVDLKAIGLVETDFPIIGGSAFETNELVTRMIMYFGRSYSVPVERNTLPVGNVIYTRIGHALCRAVGQQEVANFFDDCCLPYWRQFEGKS